MMRSPKVRVLASGGGSRPRLAAAPLIFRNYFRLQRLSYSPTAISITIRYNSGREYVQQGAATDCLAGSPSAFYLYA
jgi:hypothetical protein